MLWPGKLRGQEFSLRPRLKGKSSMRNICNRRLAKSKWISKSSCRRKSRESQGPPQASSPRTPGRMRALGRSKGARQTAPSTSPSRLQCAQTTLFALVTRMNLCLRLEPLRWKCLCKHLPNLSSAQGVAGSSGTVTASVAAAERKESD